MQKARIHKFQGHAKIKDHPISQPVTKIGGAPVGFSGPWPICRICKSSMQFILQLDLRNPVPVSQCFAIGYLFICPNYENYQGDQPCPTWDPFEGANALVLQQSSSNTAPPAPDTIAPWPERAIDFVPFVVEEEEHNTGAINPKFMELFEEAQANAPSDVADVEITLPEHWMAPKTIQIGGDPIWLQSPEWPKCPTCQGKMKLLAQVDAEVAATGFDEQKYSLPFGSAGCGYMFACEKECDVAGAAFFWQTT